MSEFKIKQTNPQCIVALERLYLKSDHKTICRECDPEAASLLAAAGSEIPIKLAIRLGLTDGGKPETKAIAPEQIESRSTRPVTTESLKKK